MKNKLSPLHLAAAILASATSFSSAAADVYGKLNVTLQNSDVAGVSEVELQSNASRFGVKGSEALSGQLQGIYQFEWEVDPTDQGNSSDNHIKSRNQFVGLQGGFGTLKLGRHDTALKVAQGKFDLFNDLDGDIKNILNGENRTSNYIGYTTPVIGQGFSATINLVPGEDAANGDDGVADASSVSLNYSANKLFLALARDTDIEGADIETTRMTGVYGLGAMQFGLLYQQTDVGALDGDGFGASFAYKLGNITYKLQYVDADIYQTGRATLENQASLGMDYKLGETTKLFGFFTTGDIGGTNDSTEYLGLGLEQKF